MSEDRNQPLTPGEWIDAEHPPEPAVRKGKGGILSWLVGILKPKEVDLVELEDMRKMPGVATEMDDQGNTRITVNEVRFNPKDVKIKRLIPPQELEEHPIDLK